jgi:hypothetical protein
MKTLNPLLISLISNRCRALASTGPYSPAKASAEILGAGHRQNLPRSLFPSSCLSFPLLNLSLSLRDIESDLTLRPSGFGGSRAWVSGCWAIVVRVVVGRGAG